MEILTTDQLQTEDARKLLRYVNDRLLRMERRVAFQNKAAAQTYLRPHEMDRFEEAVNP